VTVLGGQGAYVQTLIVDTLKVWREAERVLQNMPPAHPDHETVRRLVIELRAMYADLSETPAAAAEIVAQGRARIDAARAQLRVLVEGA
jgi:hypothetical protein